MYKTVIGCITSVLIRQFSNTEEENYTQESGFGFGVTQIYKTTGLQNVYLKVNILIKNNRLPDLSSHEFTCHFP